MFKTMFPLNLPSYLHQIFTLTYYEKRRSILKDVKFFHTSLQKMHMLQ